MYAGRMASDDKQPSATTTAQGEILPLMKELDEYLAGQGAEGEAPRNFFAVIYTAIEGAAETQDLMAPFMELSTTAFRGFTFDAQSSAMIDRILEVASMISAALSTGSDTYH